VVNSALADLDGQQIDNGSTVLLTVGMHLLGEDADPTR
jgi:hypothetical protein